MMLYFNVLLAKNVDLYLGLGIGGAGAGRRYLDIAKNGNGNAKLKAEEKFSWAHNVAGRGIFGVTYKFHQKFFTGLEGYIGNQSLENDFFKVGAFGGIRALLGMHLPYEMMIRIGLGWDAAHHSSKELDETYGNEGKRHRYVTKDKAAWEKEQLSDLSFMHHACCLNFMFAKRIKNVSFCLDGEIILPKQTQTKESMLFDFVKDKVKDDPSFTSDGSPSGKIIYRNIQWRAFASIVLHTEFLNFY